MVKGSYINSYDLNIVRGASTGNHSIKHAASNILCSHNLTVNHTHLNHQFYTNTQLNP